MTTYLVAHQQVRIGEIILLYELVTHQTSLSAAPPHDSVNIGVGRVEQILQSEICSLVKLKIDSVIEVVRTVANEFFAKLLRVQEIVIRTNHNSIIILTHLIKPNFIYDPIRKTRNFTNKNALTESADETVDCFALI